MEKQVTMKIEGMMCSHCEMHVRKALDALDGVTAKEVSHEKGEAALSLTKEVADAELKAVVEDAGYQVLGIER